MKTPLLAVLVAAFVGSSAYAGTIAPDDVVIKDGEIAQSLTGVPGDPKAGREVFADRKLGNCLACHQNSEITELSFHGEVGPEVDGVADRWEPAQLRAILVNSKAVFGEETIMPAFYYNHDKTGYRVAKTFQGKTILSAQDVEDIIAYLQTLKDE
ncbi:MAG: sulfur oxidation c-type cytochrome SoxX [Pseudomonadota bacterium]